MKFMNSLFKFLMHFPTFSCIFMHFLMQFCHALFMKFSMHFFMGVLRAFVHAILSCLFHAFPGNFHVFSMWCLRFHVFLCIFHTTFSCMLFMQVFMQFLCMFSCSCPCRIPCAFLMCLLINIFQVFLSTKSNYK